MNFGDKFNQAEIDDIFGEFEVDDDGFLESKAVIGLFVAGGGEEKEGRREEGRSSTSRSSTSRRSRRGRQEKKEEEEGRQVNWKSLDMLLFFQTSSIVIYM